MNEHLSPLTKLSVPRTGTLSIQETGSYPEVPPEGAPNDKLGEARRGAYQVEPVHPKADGYLPSWKFVMPPGVGDPPQHAWSTYSLAPVSINGPGDSPVTYLRSIGPPLTIANFAMRLQGMPVDGGTFLLTGLYTPQPLGSPSNDVYSGA